MAPPNREQVHVFARGVGPGIMALPEVNVAIFAFLLNYPWEFLSSATHGLVRPSSAHLSHNRRIGRRPLGRPGAPH
jgi:hypothetical protein